MLYHLHPQDRRDLIRKMADLLEQVPAQDTQGVLLEADSLLLDREFGHPGLVRNCDAKDPYWYEHSLIRTADEFLRNGQPLAAWRECLQETNHGNSGFVSQVRRIYRRPQRDGKEEAVSEEIRGMILNVVTELLNSKPLTKEGGVLGDGWLSVVAINDCLNLLGAVPKTLVTRFRMLLEDYEAARPDEAELPAVKSAFRLRFLL